MTGWKPVPRPKPAGFSKNSCPPVALLMYCGGVAPPSPRGHRDPCRKTLMRFGLYAEMQTPLGRSHVETYRDLLRQMEHADQVGFDVYSVIEHHFFQEFSISANPLALFCAAAQRTERIRFRVALITLPLENPMRLAGQVAEADCLTLGRLECAVGRGH